MRCDGGTLIPEQLIKRAPRPSQIADRTAVVIAALVLFACKRHDPLSRLQRAAQEGGMPPLEARIDLLPSGQSCTHHEAGNGHEPRIRLRSVAAEILLETSRQPETPTAVDLAGVAALAVERPATAIDLFRRAIAKSPHVAQYRDHLAAAYIEKNRKDQGPDALIEGLAEVDAALRIDPHRPSAAFNRAVILEELGIGTAARRQWDACARAPETAEWKADIACHRRRVDTLLPQANERLLAAAATKGDANDVRRFVRSAPQLARTTGELLYLHDWAEASVSNRDGGVHLDRARLVGVELQQTSGESLLSDLVRTIDDAAPHDRLTLASAHRTYYTARVLYTSRRSAEAQPLFEEVRRKSGQSPLRLLAGYYVACCLYDAGRTHDALALLERLLRETPERYRAIHAQLLWERSTVLSRAGELHEALAAAEASITLFQQLGEEENATVMRGAAAGLQALLGHRSDAWRTRRDIFRILGARGQISLLQQALNTAARTEALVGRWDTARALLTVNLDPSLRTNPRLTVSDLVWRGLAAARFGDTESARRDSDEAQHVAISVTDPMIRANAEAEVTFGTAVLTRPYDSRRAVELLTGFIRESRFAENPFLVAEAFLERARAYRTLHRDDDAIADLRAARAWIAARRGADRTSYGEAYFATQRNATRELIDVLESQSRAQEALAALGGGTALGPIPDHTLVIAPVVLPDRLVILAATNHTVTAQSIDVPETTVTSTVATLARCVSAEDDSCASDTAATLSVWLFQSVLSHLDTIDTMVFVPDPVFGSVPFALLRRPSTTRLLIEDMRLVVAATPTSRMSLEGVLPDPRCLIVGDPAFDGTLFPTLPRLPGAAAEANHIGRLYHRKTILVGADATRDRITRELELATVAHVATHAVVAAGDPTQTCLVLAGTRSRTSGLYVHEIARLRLSSLRAVILTGCRTATPSTVANEGESIALAFLRGGAHAVVGSLWDMDDDVAAAVGTALHRELLQGVPVADAVRHVQLAMLRSPERRYRHTTAWAGLRLYIANDELHRETGRTVRLHKQGE